MVIGKNKPLVGYYLPGTEAAKMNNGIFQTTSIDTVDVLCGHFHSQRLHLLFIQICQQGRNPHATLSSQSYGNKDCCKRK